MKTIVGLGLLLLSVSVMAAPPPKTPSAPGVDFDTLVGGGSQSLAGGDSPGAGSSTAQLQLLNSLASGALLYSVDLSITGVGTDGNCDADLILEKRNSGGSPIQALQLATVAASDNAAAAVSHDFSLPIRFSFNNAESGETMHLRLLTTNFGATGRCESAATIIHGPVQ